VKTFAFSRVRLIHSALAAIPISPILRIDRKASCLTAPTARRPEEIIMAKSTSSGHGPTESIHTRAHLGTPTDLTADAVRDICAGVNGLLADVFALYLKTKNFHWHMSGPHFRDYHLLLDEHGDQIFAMTDPLAERARKIGGTTLRSIGHIARQQRIPDNDAAYVEPKDMLAELREDNQKLVAEMRQVHNVADKYGDVATASLLEVWIDETERRTWFLFEAGRSTPGANA
jgi:starvation-inducible DNA-binding protein